MTTTNPYISPKRTNPYISPKRPRPSPSVEEIFPTSTKRLHPSQSSTQTSTQTSSGDDVSSNGDSMDSSSFELDLSQCPEISTMDDKFTQLKIDDPIKISEEEGDEMQKAAIAHATSGGLLFLTGKAGTGKSWTSKQIRAKLRHRNMWVVAPTGVAAINVDGMTIHAWGGFGEFFLWS